MVKKKKYKVYIIMDSDVDFPMFVNLTRRSVILEAEDRLGKSWKELKNVYEVIKAEIRVVK